MIRRETVETKRDVSASRSPSPSHLLHTLLRRTFDVDVTRCTGCAGRMTVRAVVTDPASIDRLLAALRRARDPPVAA